MTVTEVLQLMDQLVAKHTGKTLDDLQKRAILGLLSHQKYDDIAKDINYDDEYIGKISRELFAILHEELKQLGQDEPVKKSNFATSLEKIAHSYNPNFFPFHNIKNSHINLCSNLPQNASQDIINKPNSVNECYHDLKLAPKIIRFGDRTTELQTLFNWICKGERPFTPTLICILGLSGIGKTTLVKKFVDLNLDKFEVIIWKKLNFPKSLDLLINDFLNLCQQEPQETLPDKLTQLFDILNHKKCLIILDDLQNIFIPGEFPGQYKPEYQDYQNFFTMITETEHQSNVIVISQEQCTEIMCLDDNLCPSNYIELSGLETIEILNNMGLKEQEHWLTLIKLYEGNPIYLKSVASLIKTLYYGKVSEFLAENSLIITKEIKNYCSKLFHRLSPIEQTIILHISKSDQPLSKEELNQNITRVSTDIMLGLQSLHQRYLITTIEEEKITFNLNIVFKEYVRNYC